MVDSQPKAKFKPRRERLGPGIVKSSDFTISLLTNQPAIATQKTSGHRCPCQKNFPLFLKGGGRTVAEIDVPLLNIPLSRKSKSLCRLAASADF